MTDATPFLPNMYTPLPRMDAPFPAFFWNWHTSTEILHLERTHIFLLKWEHLHHQEWMYFLSGMNVLSLRNGHTSFSWNGYHFNCIIITRYQICIIYVTRSWRFVAQDGSSLQWSLVRNHLCNEATSVTQPCSPLLYSRLCKHNHGPLYNEATLLSSADHICVVFHSIFFQWYALMFLTLSNLFFFVCLFLLCVFVWGWFYGSYYFLHGQSF